MIKIARSSSVWVETRDLGVRELDPAGRFSRLIEKYYYIPGRKGDKQRALEILPGGHFRLIFILSASFCKLLFHGPFTRKVFWPLNNSCEYFCVDLRSGLIPRVADIDSAELLDNAVILPRLFGVAADEMGERLIKMPGFEAGLRFIEKVLGAAEQETRGSDGLFQRLSERIALSRGTIRVEELAAGSGVSRRTIERLFQKRVGLTPKTYIRYTRFQHAVEKLKSGRKTGLTDIAYDCGYYDQSHFIKDFKQFFGETPGPASLFSPVAFLQYNSPDKG